MTRPTEKHEYQIPIMMVGYPPGPVPMGTPMTVYAIRIGPLELEMRGLASWSSHAVG